MTMIFVGGSRDIFELPEGVVTNIGNIVAAGHGVLIGDAPGADAEAQSLLAGYGYERVDVFHGGRKPRYNLGDWAACHIAPLDGVRGFAVHAAKDREMARRADYGLMVWDGSSPGTALNVFRLARIGSPCVVYDMKRVVVSTVRELAGWRALINHAGPKVLRQVEARMTQDEHLSALATNEGGTDDKQHGGD